jgi:hypothetical protein
MWCVKILNRTLSRALSVFNAMVEEPLADGGRQSYTNYESNAGNPVHVGRKQDLRPDVEICSAYDE